MSAVLLLCGSVAALLGAWRSYAVAREALTPFVHDGEPTRSAIESARPVTERPRVRLFVRRVAVSLAWLAVAMYGLYLVSAAEAVAG